MFSHEKLTVYQKAIAFVAWTQPVLESLSAKVSSKDQLDRASTSVALNIAEGEVKFSVTDRARFVQIATGSAVESAACLDVLVARKLIQAEEAAQGRVQLQAIVNMLMGLLDRLGYRFDDGQSLKLREEPGSEYGGLSI